MTTKEMTQIFSVMMLAWPNAEMFKGGTERLKPTIELWTTCLADVAFRTAQQTVKRMCRTCKFPPTIAEFREQAHKFQSELENQAEAAMNTIRSLNFLFGSLDAAYHKLPCQNPIRAAIDAMGGPNALIKDLGGVHIWQWETFRKAYIDQICRIDNLPDSSRRALLATREGD